MKLYVKWQINNKKFIVWYKNQEWYCQVINPKWVGEYMIVKQIVVELVYNKKERILVVELE